MSTDDELLKVLQEALAASPDNVALRKQVADLLLEAGRYQEAETAYRQVLNATPEDDSVKLSLAETFYHQGKGAIALVILERLITSPDVTAAVFLLSARVYLEANQIAEARTAYKEAIRRDSSVADVILGQKLQIKPDPTPTEQKSSEDEEQTAVFPPADDQRVLVSVDPPEPSPHFDLEKVLTSFKDVGGMDTLKEEIQLKIIHPLQHPEIYKAYGKKIGGGILMYGPPGCGKTHLARATAGEVNAYFLSIGLHDVLDMYLGQSEQNLHGLFELARRYAPCVLFIDEVDALGANRTDMRRSAGRQLINQFLSELDGVEYSNEGVLVLAATNAPWHLDPAFRRPGRFDQVIFVPPPDTTARAAIFQIMMQDKPVETINFEQLARKTENFSGADIKGVVDIAVENKLREAMKKGVLTPLKTEDLFTAIKKVKPSTNEWFSSARNYALYANQSGLYDDILTYMKSNRDLSSRFTFRRGE